jgi:hypothetical protein
MFIIDNICSSNSSRISILGLGWGTNGSSTSGQFSGPPRSWCSPHHSFLPLFFCISMTGGELFPRRKLSGQLPVNCHLLFNHARLQFNSLLRWGPLSAWYQPFNWHWFKNLHLRDFHYCPLYFNDAGICGLSNLRRFHRWSQIVFRYDPRNSMLVNTLDLSIVLLR